MYSSTNSGEAPFNPAILTVKPLDPQTGIVRIFDPLKTRRRGI